MHAFVLSLLALSVTGASLRQAAPTTLVQPLELFNQLFVQAFDTTTQSLELRVLTMLYPDNAADIQAVLDQCEADAITTNNEALEKVSADVIGLGQACASEDPTAPVNTLIQDTLQMMANVAAPCDGLPVDLVADVENLIATALVQGFEFSGLWVGPLNQWAATSLQPIEGVGQYLQPVSSAVGSVAGAVGVTDETLAKVNTDVTASVGAWSAVLDSIAAGTLSPDDVVAALDTELLLLNDGGAVYGDVVNSAAKYANQAVGAVCSFVGPLFEAMQPEEEGEEQQ